MTNAVAEQMQDGPLLAAAKTLNQAAFADLLGGQTPKDPADVCATTVYLSRTHASADKADPGSGTATALSEMQSALARWQTSQAAVTARVADAMDYKRGY